VNDLKRIIKFSILLIIFGCSGSDDGNQNDATLDYIDLYVSDTQVFIGNSLVFSVFTSTGNNVTTSTDFYVNSVKIPSNTHIFNDVGVYDVYASYNGMNSETIQVSVFPTPLEFKRNVLVEDFTGTWCGWCPRVSYAIKLLKDQEADVSFVAVHNGDQMTISGEAALRQFFGVNSFPTAIINREATWSGNQPGNLAQVTGEIGKKAYSSVAIESSLDGRQLSVTVKLKMGFSYEQIRLGLFLLEDDLRYNQSNYTSYYSDITNGQTAIGFIHDDVLRHSFSNIFGDVISGENVGHDKIYSKEFQYTIPPNFKIENLKLVGFAADFEERYFINSRSSNIGENQNFQPVD